MVSNSIIDNYSLTDNNTFHIAVRARYYAEFSDDDRLRTLLEYAQIQNLRIFILGGGANILFTKDFDGLIIHPVSSQIIVDGNTVVADAGVCWDNLVDYTISHGLGGLENLSLIPGTVGAAPVQNIGAYGIEAKDVIKWVEYMGVDDRKIHRLKPEECKFGYRDSVFKHELKGKAVVMRVAFELKKEDKDYRYNISYGSVQSKIDEIGQLSVLNIRKAIISIRSSKLPDPKITGNAGSFFRNPEVSQDKLSSLKSVYPDIESFPLQNGNYKISAGWLIEKSGWKGRSLGKVSVHDRQALVLVNNGDAEGKDVLALSERVRGEVLDKFGVELSPEVIIL